MSNNIIEFLNKRNEVKLSSEKIELGLVDDGRSLLKMVVSSVNNVNGLKSKIKSESKSGIDNSDRAIKLINEAIKQAKALGIDDYPSDWDKIIKELKDYNKELKTNM